MLGFLTANTIPDGAAAAGGAGVTVALIYALKLLAERRKSHTANGGLTGLIKGAFVAQDVCAERHHTVEVQLKNLEANLGAEIKRVHHRLDDMILLMPKRSKDSSRFIE